MELLDAGHDPLPRPLALHIDIAVIGITDEAVTASLHQIRQIDSML
jgi:hypothetical protein